MPLYEYKCLSCGKIFEVRAKFSDPPLKTHAECGGEVEQLATAPAFHLKGTGWYATDYAKKSSPPSVKADDTKGESKPADGKSDDKSAEKKSAASETKSETKPSSSSSESKSDSK